MPPPNPVIYYYPSSGFDAQLVTIDLGEILSDLQMTPIRSAIDAMSYQGRFYRTNLNGRMKIRVLLERFTDRALVRKLYSLQSHLERGGLIGICENQNKAWAAYLNEGMGNSGQTVLETGGNVFYNQTAALDALDEVVIQSSNPEVKREWNDVNLAVGSTDARITLSDALIHNYKQEPVLIRFHGFWPIMRLPADQLGRPIVTHDHRISYTLDLTLEEDVAALAAASTLFPGQLLQDGDGPAGFGQTIDKTLDTSGSTPMFPPYGH